MKRFLDIFTSLVALTLLLPVFLLIVVVIYLSDPGPIFYRQRRVGKGGKVFLILKFRSMIVDADKVGGYSTQDNDPRITAIGCILRKTSLDELPQLWNVLVGDMSLVGPRPDVPAQRETYTQSEWQKRHLVRPGITGLAQATVRSSASAEERKRLDLQYVDSRSLGEDIRILVLTLKQIFATGGN